MKTIQPVTKVAMPCSRGFYTSKEQNTNRVNTTKMRMQVNKIGGKEKYELKKIHVGQWPLGLMALPCWVVGKITG